MLGRVSILVNLLRGIQRGRLDREGRSTGEEWRRGREGERELYNRSIEEEEKRKNSTITQLHELLTWSVQSRAGIP